MILFVLFPPAIAIAVAILVLEVIAGAAKGVLHAVLYPFKRIGGKAVIPTPAWHNYQVGSWDGQDGRRHSLNRDGIEWWQDEHGMPHHIENGLEHSIGEDGKEHWIDEQGRKHWIDEYAFKNGTNTMRWVEHIEGSESIVHERHLSAHP